MKTYALSPTAIARQKQRVFRRGMITMLAASVLPLAVMYATRFISGWVLLFVLPIIAVVVVVGVRRGLKITEENLSSYRLRMGDETISRQQAGIPEVEIPYTQITAVQESALTGLVLKTADRTQTIYILPALDDYAEVKAEVLRRKPAIATFAHKGARAWLLYIPTVLFFVAFAALWLSRNLPVVLAAGGFILAYWFWAWTLVRRRQDIDARAKLGIWHLVVVTLVFALLIYTRVAALWMR